MKNHIRIFCAVLSILLVFIMLFSASYIIENHNHDCSGENCDICNMLFFCRAFLNSVKFTIITLIFFAIYETAKRLFCTVNSNKSENCILKKVKLLI